MPTTGSDNGCGWNTALHCFGINRQNVWIETTIQPVQQTNQPSGTKTNFHAFKCWNHCERGRRFQLRLAIKPPCNKNQSSSYYRVFSTYYKFLDDNLTFEILWIENSIKVLTILRSKGDVFFSKILTFLPETLSKWIQLKFSSSHRYAWVTTGRPNNRTILPSSQFSACGWSQTNNPVESGSDEVEWSQGKPKSKVKMR